MIHWFRSKGVVIIIGGWSDTKTIQLKNLNTILLHPLNQATVRSVLIAFKMETISLLVPVDDPPSSQMLFRMHLLFVEKSGDSRRRVFMPAQLSLFLAMGVSLQEIYT